MGVDECPFETWEIEAKADTFLVEERGFRFHQRPLFTRVTCYSDRIEKKTLVWVEFYYPGYVIDVEGVAEGDTIVFRKAAVERSYCGEV